MHNRYKFRMAAGIVYVSASVAVLAMELTNQDPLTVITAFIAVMMNPLFGLLHLVFLMLGPLTFTVILGLALLFERFIWGPFPSEIAVEEQLELFTPDELRRLRNFS